LVVIGFNQNFNFMMIDLKEIIGNKYGRLVVLNQENSIKGHKMVKCICECGNYTIIRASALTSKNTFSCGCLNIETRPISLAKGHNIRANGAINNKDEYRCYQHMKSRCYTPTDAKYKNYGARGIIVCERWLNTNGFKNFLLDMGKRPSKSHSIERDKINGNYEPNNCRWATNQIQSRNKTTTIRLHFNNIEYCQSDFAELCNVTDHSIEYHLKKGKTPTEIFNYFNNKNYVN